MYTGKPNWRDYAVNEMATLVIPFDISVGAPVGLYTQWTVDAAGRRKESHLVNAVFESVDGTSEGTFTDGHYTYQVTLDDELATIIMSAPSRNPTTNTFEWSEPNPPSGNNVCRNSHIMRNPMLTGYSWTNYPCSYAVTPLVLLSPMSTCDMRLFSCSRVKPLLVHSFAAIAISPCTNPCEQVGVSKYTCRHVHSPSDLCSEHKRQHLAQDAAQGYPLIRQCTVFMWEFSQPISSSCWSPVNRHIYMPYLAVYPR